MNIYDLISLCIHYECPQDKKELKQMLDIVKGKTSVLEVGSNFGGTFYRMSEVVAPKSLMVSVDWPVDETPKSLEPVESLKMNCKRISMMGHHVELFIGDSHANDTVQRVEEFAPFDFVFIDGDHSYEGVKADWMNYGPMGKIVGFHDIAGPVEGCVRLWNELKAEGKYRLEELITPGSGMGIGIVYKENAPRPQFQQ